MVSCIAGRFFTVWATREAHKYPTSHQTFIPQFLYLLMIFAWMYNYYADWQSWFHIFIIPSTFISCLVDTWAFKIIVPIY